MSGFRGVRRDAGGRGLSCLDQIGFRRRALKGKDGPLDPPQLSVSLVSELRSLGL